jgi:hypothetical protein
MSEGTKRTQTRPNAEFSILATSIEVIVWTTDINIFPTYQDETRPRDNSKHFS